jgi:transcriptional regulator with XRE-family HTH domain
MEPTWTIGDRLRKARETAGVGVSEMADKLGVERQTIRRWERASVVRGQTVLAYAQVCDVDAGWLHGEYASAGDSLRSRCLSDRVAS